MDTPQDENEINSLESQDTTVQPDNGPSSADNNPDPGNHDQPTPPKRSFTNRLRALVSHLNVYLLLFILIVFVALLIVFVARQRSIKENPAGPTATQTLTQETLDQLENSETSIGDPKQILNVESNAVFTGKVLIRDSLDVAGTIKVGGALSLPGITVSGPSAFEDVQINNLAIAGDTTIQGQLSVQGNLTIAGGGSFAGPVSAPQITVNTLQLNSDLQINRHIDAGGGTPGKSNGSAVGGGGTASVSGTDTAGTVTINTGGNPPAGCFITVSFAQAFNGTPHVVITPVGSSAAGLNYYVTRSTSNFSICTTNPAPSGRSFSFDYIVID